MAAAADVCLDNWGSANPGQAYMVRGRNSSIENSTPWNGDTLAKAQSCNYDPGPACYDTDAGAQNARLHGFRYRHMQNTSMNMLFADGHVEAFKIGELRRKNYYVNVRTAQ